MDKDCSKVKRICDLLAIVVPVVIIGVAVICKATYRVYFIPVVSGAFIASIGNLLEGLKNKKLKKSEILLSIIFFLSLVFVICNAIGRFD